MKRILLILLMIGGIAYGQCPQVTGLSVSSLSTTGGKASYTAASGATLYVWGIYVPGGAFVTGGSTTSTTFNFTGLTASTTYRLKVRTTCGLSVSGDDSLTFSTLSASAMYTPLTAQGYQIKYLKADSGFNLPLRDTALLRGIDQAGAQVYKPGSGVFVYNGSYWQGISGGTGTIIITDSSKGIDSITFNGYQECIYLHDSITPTCWQLNRFFDDVRLSDDSLWYKYYNAGSVVDSVPSGIKNVGAVWPLSYNGTDLTTSKPFNDSLYLSSLVLHGTSLYSKKLTGDSVFVGIMGSGGSTGIDSMYVTSDSLYQVFIYSSGRRDSVGYSGSSGTGGTGTVTSIATGLGLSGGPITTTGTIIVDTTVIASQARLTAMLALKLNITDTANMRFRPIAGTNVTLSGTYPNITIAASGSGGSSGIIYDTIPVWNRVGAVLVGDTSTEVNLVGEPSVIREGSPQILTVDTTVFKMWYGTGAETVCYAESVDGITWVKYSGNPVVSSHLRNYVIKNGSTYYMYVANHAQTQIDVYTSSNGLSWTLAAAAAISNPSGSDYNTAVIVSSGTWHLLVDGLVGGAYVEYYYTSSDGISWSIQNGGTPVISGRNASAPFLTKIGSTYYVWLNQNSGGTTLPSDVYRYSSTDMINWTMMANATWHRRQLDEGAETAIGQAGDIYMVPVNNGIDSAVYMFYSAARDGVNVANYGVKVKLAIANMSFSKLVGTKEGDKNGVIATQVFQPSTNGLNGYNKEGSIAIGNYYPAASAILDLTSTTKGLLTPRMTTTQMNAISSPATGLTIFNTTANNPYYYNGSAWIGLNAWNILGNSGTDSTTNFLGTTDNKPLLLKLNNTYKGVLSPSMNNYFIGGYPTSVTGAGISNAGMGASVGAAITSGHNNALFGYTAGAALTTGSFNTAVGPSALVTTQTGNNNTAIGVGALGSAAITGADNTAVGHSAGAYVTSGSSNVAIGQNALSLAFVTGSSNLALGVGGLSQNTSGGSNISLGVNAGYYNTTVSNQFFVDFNDRNNYDGNKNQALLYGVMSTSILSQKLTVAGRFAINNSSPTAYLQLTPGSNATNTAPLKFTQDSIVTTAATGNGTTATITFASQSFIIPVGATIRITGMTPSGYNGTYTVSASTATTVSFLNATSAAQTVAGRVTTGMLLTTPEGGSMEYDGTDYYLTDKTATRYLLSRTLTGTAAPATTPTAIGIHFIDTVNKKEYVSTGTSSSADWTILNNMGLFVMMIFLPTLLLKRKEAA